MGIKFLLLSLLCAIISVGLIKSLFTIAYNLKMPPFFISLCKYILSILTPIPIIGWLCGFVATVLFIIDGINTLFLIASLLIVIFILYIINLHIFINDILLLLGLFVCISCLLTILLRKKSTHLIEKRDYIITIFISMLSAIMLLYSSYNFNIFKHNYIIAKKNGKIKTITQIPDTILHNAIKNVQIDKK